MRFLLLLSLLLSSCASPEVAVERDLEQPLFAPPARGFTIPAPGDDGWTMERLLLEYGRVTNQRCLFDLDTLEQLRALSVPLDAELLVEPVAMHSVVEWLLVEMEFMLSIVREEDPRILRAHFIPQDGRVNVPLPPGELVPVSGIDRWRDHPAYFVRTILPCEIADGQATWDALRASLHQTDVRQIFLLSEKGPLVLQGPSMWVLNTVILLRAAEVAGVGHGDGPQR